MKHWTTLNEPYRFSNAGYNLGVATPGRCSKYVQSFCPAGHSATEPYIVTHNLLSHAAAVKVYREPLVDNPKGI